ncbi:4Fe-4S binding protein [Elusimicrobiota bacterium]
MRGLAVWKLGKMKIKTIKIITQSFIFVLICFAFWYLRYPVSDWFNPTYFFQLSPVAVFVSVFFITTLIVSAGLLIFTFIFGRVFCGWICPYGTLMDVFAFLISPVKKYKESNPKIIKSKYFLFIILTILTFFGFQLFYFFEPVTIFARGFYFTIYSVKNNLFIDLFYKIMSANPGAVIEGIYSVFKSSIIENRHVVFNNHIVTFIFFTVPLLLVLIKRRFWCRYICPLGACLAVVAKFSVIKRESASCDTQCGRCVNQCRMNAVKNDNRYIKQECILCMDCVSDVCDKKSKFIFSFKNKKNNRIEKTGVTRKDFILWTVVAVSLLAVKKTFARTERNIIRPPGALDEETFKQKCARCGNCMKVCVTNGLQPVLLESGIDGIWTPKIDANIGYCEYECVLCGQVCPTQAILKLTETYKKQTKIGIAKIQKDICVPWKDGLECLVCEEHCPVPSKAIKLKKEIISDNEVDVPYIEEELCIGCAICENKCPALINNKKGIVVEPI